MRFSMPYRPVTASLGGFGVFNRRVMARAVALVAVVGLVAGCAEAQPQRDYSAQSLSQVRILVNPESMEAMVLGEIYRQTLREEGRDAILMRDNNYSPRQGVDKLVAGDADFLVVCTGNLFYTLDQDSAVNLAAERAADTEKNKDYLEATHMGMMGALPTTLTTVDPSSAPGCKDDTLVDLPQNYVPVYAKDLLNRQERFEVASVTKYLTEDDLNALVKDAEEDGDVVAPVALWIETSSAAQDNQSGQQDSASTDSSK